MSPQEIVMLNMNTCQAYLQGVSNRNWQVLQELLRRESVKQVLAVDFPPLNLKQQLRFLIKGSKASGQVIAKGTFWQLVQVNKKLFVLSLLSKSYNQVQITRQIKKCIAILGFNNYSLWSYVPLLAECFGSLGEKQSVFDAVDNWQIHQSYNKPELRVELGKSYQIISKKADVVFTVAKDLLKLFPEHKNIHWIPNGVDLEHFAGAKTIPLEIKKLPRPIIGYHGVIQNRVDLDLLEKIAKQFNQGSLVLIGPTWPNFLAKIRPKSPEKKRLAKYNNVHFLGAVAYQKLPSYIAGFDVGIIPHLKTEFTETMNPLKLYEYLACGKPVVATPIAGVEQFSQLIKIASSQDEFCQQIKQSLSLNSPDLIKKRQASVVNYSWKRRVDQMLSYLA